MNFLQETKDVLERNNKTFKNIKNIYGNEFQITLENFIDFADKDYDNGYGGQEMPEDIKILGDDFYMTRDEYDGSENWVYHTMPNKITLPFKKIEQKEKRAMWEDMSFWIREEK